MARPKGTKNKPVEVPEQEADKSSYAAKIKILGKFYESTGQTAFEAIDNLKPDGVAKGVALLIVSKGEVKQERFLPAVQVSNLFSRSRIMREIALKNTALRFGL